MIAPSTSIVDADDDRTAVLAEFGIERASPPVETAATELPALSTDRDHKGRFVKGHHSPGPGRPKGQGLDLRALAERESEREGFDLPAAAWRVLKRLFAMAEAGDVAAAKLVLDKLGVVDDAQQAGVQLVVVTGVDAATGEPATGIALRVTAAGTGEPA